MYISISKIRIVASVFLKNREKKVKKIRMNVSHETKKPPFGGFILVILHCLLVQFGD